MTQLMEQAIRRMLDEEPERQAAKQRILERMRNSPDRGIGGKITWTRDELYDR